MHGLGQDNKGFKVCEPALSMALTIRFWFVTFPKTVQETYVTGRVKKG